MVRGTLRNRRQFRLVYEKGSKAVGRLCVVYAYRPEHSECQDVGDDAFGVVASKKVGNAVARARAKRRLREAYRQSHARIMRPRWVVLIARNGLAAKSLPSQRIEEEMKQLLQELEVFPTSGASPGGEDARC